jgi:hypothetical protein
MHQIEHERNPHLPHLTIQIRRLASAAAIAAGVAFAAYTPAAAEGPAPELKVQLDAPAIVTSVGQSLDAFSVQLAVKRAGVEPAYDNHMTADDVTNALIEGEHAKTLFLAVGASVKGFGEAGISIDQEIVRTTKILDAAKAAKMKVVMIHLGGKDRRDDLSDQLIKLVAPRSDVIIVVPGSDDDMMIKKIADNGAIPYRVTASAITLAEDLKGAFGSGT